MLNKLQRDAAGRIKLGLDLQGGQSFLVEMDTTKLADGTDAESAIAQAVEVLRRRVDKFGVAEPVIQPAGGNRISIQMPGLSEADKESARQQISRAAFLEFRMVHPQSAQLLAEGITREPGYEILYEQEANPDGTTRNIPLFVKRKPEGGLTGKYMKRAMAVFDPVTGQPEIQFELDGEGAVIMSKLSRENIGQRMAIVLDGVIYSAPSINSEIGAQGRITGKFDVKEAKQLEQVLENPLEAPLTIIEERGVDPSLGKDSIDSGVKAALYGTIAVALFMIVYYLLAGVVANVALLLNIVVLLGVMCSVGTTLTLPGIAGIVLTIGMAVDANVLIFERIREEFAAGKSLRGAVSAGYDKAFGTIFDANITTLISSIILIFLGTGPVKGFGVTLTIGVAVSMFTALVVTRLMFDFLLARNLIRSLPMLRFIKGTKLDFLGVAEPAFAASWLLILVGVGFGFKRGFDGGLFGVDFKGGDSITYAFSEKVGVEKVRESVKALGFGDPAIQYQRNIGSNTEVLVVTTAYEKGAEVTAKLEKDFPGAKLVVKGQDRVGPTVGGEIQKAALVSMLLALFGILVYVAFRYEFSFAVGAVVAILHDLLMTFGVFSLAGLELSAPIVAAFLTIIGFSINDTIVIFDRIREDLKLGVRGSFKDVMNKALNQTLSRTIITSGTVFLSTSALYLFGGGAVKDFAFTFLVGILTGTYSSIFIASALVLWWHKGQRPSLGAGVSAESVPSAAVRV
ncbi:MAG: protein translocase subunit SecD [Verrucomicrobiae bacterium]|nr:protein translocase subunit SecD [Verrucomicrobiae bacterium]